MTRTQQQAVAQLVRQWLDAGSITAMEALKRVHMLRQQGGEHAVLASVVDETVQQWHDAYAQRMQGRET